MQPRPPARAGPGCAWLMRNSPSTPPHPHPGATGARPGIVRPHERAWRCDSPSLRPPSGRSARLPGEASAGQFNGRIRATSSGIPPRLTPRRALWCGSWPGARRVNPPLQHGLAGRVPPRSRLCSGVKTCPRAESAQAPADARPAVPKVHPETPPPPLCRREWGRTRSGGWRGRQAFVGRAWTLRSRCCDR